jgi:hypothetical protein
MDAEIETQIFERTALELRSRLVSTRESDAQSQSDTSRQPEWLGGKLENRLPTIVFDENQRGWEANTSLRESQWKLLAVAVISIYKVMRLEMA